jgi:hypothetical protein
LARPYGDVMHFNLEGYHYMKSKGRYFKATLSTRTGKTFNVGQFHSALEDHFHAIRESGLVVTDLAEPVTSPELAKKHPFLREVEGEAVCMIIAGRKTRQD